MMKLLSNILLPIFLLTLFATCQSGQKTLNEESYLLQVGDIRADPDLDEPAFALCNGEEYAFQYFNTGEGFRYKGEKSALITHFKQAYKPVTEGANNSGYIRIRFIVNCKGEIGRLRLLTSDFEYHPMEFHGDITEELLSIIKEMDGWEILMKNESPLDYYMYLIFKIDKGQIIEILP